MAHHYDVDTHSGQSLRIQTEAHHTDHNWSSEVARILHDNFTFRNVGIGMGIVSSVVSVVNGTRQAQIQRKQLELIEEQLKRLRGGGH